MSSTTLTGTQEFIANGAVQWFKSETAEQVYPYVGFAGTGKTFIIHEIIDRINREGIKLSYDEIAFCAYTGKAALVMTQKSGGKFIATTIHRLAYELDDSSGGPQFVVRDKETLTKKYKLIVVDEASMVDGLIEQDLKSFGIKIIAVGDLGQLEPILNGKNAIRGTLLDNPVAELTEIHRQAENNPVIYLSMLARQGKRIEPGKYGKNVMVLRKNGLSNEKKVALYQRADQIICGYNKTRQTVNNQVRQRLGFSSPFPEVNDKLICTKNNWNKELKDINLINGLTGFVKDVNLEVEKTSSIKHDAMQLTFQPDFIEKGVFDELYLLKGDFRNEKIFLERNEYSTYDKFDFGYAITCHKSQGSSWGNVVLINEVLNSESHNRWLYTGITRAEENLILFI